MIKECELVANTEVPKFDVHEWRKQRDVDMFGQVMLGLLPHVIAQVHTPYPTPYLPPPHPLLTLHTQCMNSTHFESFRRQKQMGEWKCAMTTNTNMCYFSHFTADTFSSHEVEADPVRH